MSHFQVLRSGTTKVLATLARTSAAVMALSAFAPTASAVDFTLDNGITGSLDSTYTFGAAIRTKSADPDLIGLVNGGRAFSINGDNGNLNFSKGDFVSAVARGVNELQLKADNISFFARVNYFYDHINRSTTLDRTPLTGRAQHLSGLDADLLDLYIAGNFDVGDHPLSVRVGNQVLSWGESTFIQNGINVVNPFDVSKLRTAGSELREGVVPVPIVQSSIGFGDLSIEAFYQIGWDHTEIESEGTFFSTNDFASPGGQYVFLRFGLPPGPKDNPASLSQPPVGSIVNRAPDRDASDGGQFGVALRYLATELNDTEFGAYFIKYHSRLPVLSGRTGQLSGLVLGDYARTAAYYREFPEDIKLVGGSFNTTIGGTAIQAEYSYHFDQPLQVDDVELLFAALSPIDSFLGLAPAGVPIFGRSQLGRYGFNQEVVGWRRKDYSQAQGTVTELIPTLGPFDQIALVGEVGATWIHNMEGKSVLRYEGPGTFTSANPVFTQLTLQPGTAPIKGFADAFSWGYRLALRGDINNAIGSVTLQPTIAFNHDVTGTTPAPIGNFVDGRKSLTLALGASYLNAWQASLAYTTNWGGGVYNLLRDRDFVQFSVSYSF
ncbi:MAG: DUF1302 domain-containing protein [Rhodospirillaceae bacterium]|nr:DUF1302 domain-containing protein [Rhodospirillaceae bacterium]